MSKDILGSLLRVLVTVPEDRLGLVQDFSRKLAGADGETWVLQSKSFLRKEISWADEGIQGLLDEREMLKYTIARLTNGVTQVTEPKPTPLILELVGTVMVRATTSKFIAKEKLVVNTESGVLVKIGHLNDNFTNWFLSGDGKTEDPMSEQMLRYHKLCKVSDDGPIITELDGEAKALTALSDMFSLMEKQKNGENGVLLKNGYANIFYILDQNGVLRAVRVYWYDDGWDVDAFSVEDSGRWDDGGQVFSRNSVLESSGPLVPAQV